MTTKIRSNVAAGFSLIEVLLIMVLLSSTIVPFILMTTQTSQNARGLAIHSTRSILVNRLIDEMDPARPDFVSQFSGTTMQTSISELGQTIPYIRNVDTTTAGASSAFKKTTNFYIYNSTSDATSSPRYKNTQIAWAEEIFIDCGGNTKTPVTDNSLRQWARDGAYSAANKQPGYVAAGSTGISASDIVNTAGNDDIIYQSYRQAASGSSLDYTFDVPDGYYVVKLYFAEPNTGAGSSPNVRKIDISLEGVVKLDAYNIYSTTGNAANRANIQSFNIQATGGTLTVSLSKDATSDLDPILSGISVSRQTLQSPAS